MSSEINGVYFSPQEGELYNTQKTRILLLGESHYGKDEGENKTRNVVNRYLSGTEKYKFFTCALGAIFGKGFDKEIAIKKIVFYNYIQEIVGENSRCRPTDGQWDKAIAPFFNVLSKYLPDIVICCGKSLYEHLPYNPGEIEKSQHGVSLGGDEAYVWNREYHYQINGKNIRLIAMRHPSSRGFNAGKYYEEIFDSISG